MSKTLVILSGTSGTGKSTCIEPYMIENFNAEVLSTGTVFKAMIGLAREPFHVAPDINFVPKEKDALRWMYDTGALSRGVEAYERAKQSNMNGYQVCLAAEAGLRAVLADAPAYQVALMAQWSQADIIVTDVINKEELGYLLSRTSDLQMSRLLIRLDCKNPKSRNGDNRKPITLDYIKTTIKDLYPDVFNTNICYSLEELPKVCDAIGLAVKSVSR